MMDSLVLLPVAMATMGYVTAAVPKHSALRPLFLAFGTACCLGGLRSTLAWKIPGAALHDWMAGYILHMSHFFLIARLQAPPDVTTWKQRALFGINQSIDGRWGIDRRAIPHFDAGRPNYVPSRSKLFMQRLVDFAISASLAYYLQHYEPFVWPDDYYHPGGFLSRLGQVSAREWQIRVYVTVCGVAIPYLAMRGAHCLTTCIALALGDAPERWPPLYGDIREAYTMRRWYSMFWHRAMRKALTSHANLLVHGVLRLPRRSPAARYLTTLAAFALSALMHIACCPGREWCVAPAQFALYLGTAGALAAEDCVAAAYRRLTRQRHAEREIEAAWANGRATASGAALEPKPALGVRSRAPNGSANGAAPRTPRTPKTPKTPGAAGAAAKPWWAFRLVGFLWVAAFQLWSVSNLMYAIYNC